MLTLACLLVACCLLGVKWQTTFFPSAPWPKVENRKSPGESAPKLTPTPENPEKHRKVAVATVVHWGAAPRQTQILRVHMQSQLVIVYKCDTTLNWICVGCYLDNSIQTNLVNSPISCYLDNKYKQSNAIDFV